MYNKAADALQALFFVGLQEEFDISALALIRKMNVSMTPDIKKERDQSNSRVSAQKKALLEDEKLMEKAKRANSYDIALYSLGEKLNSSTSYSQHVLSIFSLCKTYCIMFYHSGPCLCPYFNSEGAFLQHYWSLS